MKSRISRDHWAYQVPIAHRGLHDVQFPENSLAAFRAAVAQGYAIELDLHLLPDGNFAVFHDDDLKRMTGQEGKIQSLSTAQLTEYKLKATDEATPEFHQVLDCVAGKVPLLIEMKLTKDNAKAAVALREVMHAYQNRYAGAFVVESFDPRFLLALKEVAPEMIRGQLAAQNSGYPDPEENRRLAQCAYNVLTEPDFIAYHISDLPLAWLEVERKEGMPVLGWTVRNNQQWNEAKPHCDNLIFEGIRLEKIGNEYRAVD